MASGASDEWGRQAAGTGAGHFLGVGAGWARMNMSVVLYAYASLLVAGGLVGWLKAGSRASMAASMGCAVPVVLVALGVLPMLVARVEMGFLVVFFAMRWVTTGKPMPAAPVIVLTLAALTWTLVSRG